MDARWDETLEVLRRFTAASTPTQGALITAVERDLVARYGPCEVPLPHRATAYRRMKELSKGRHAFGSAKQRRSVATARRDHTAGCGRHGRASTWSWTPRRWTCCDGTGVAAVGAVELTVAQDLFTRCILGLRVTPISTRAADVANVLYQCVAPRGTEAESSAAVWPFHGVPPPGPSQRSSRPKLRQRGVVVSVLTPA